MTPTATAAEAPKSSAEATEVPKPPPKATEAAKPVAEKPAIKIGILQTMTGPQAVGGSDIAPGFSLYLSEKNNTLAGRKIQLVIEDDEAKPDVALTKTKKLVEHDNVQMLVGTNNSGVAIAIVEYVKSQKIPLLITGSGADDLTKQRFSPYVFRNGFTNSQISYALGDWAYKKGYRKASLLASDYSAGHEWAGGFARTFIEAGGTVIQEQYVALGAPDPAPYITTIKPEADVMFAFQTGADALRFVPTYEQYGLKKRTALTGVSGLTDDDVLSKQGDSALGVVLGAPYSSALDTPATKAFLAAFAKNNNNRVPSYHAAFSYEAAMILDKALQTTKGNIEDTDAFIKALEGIEINDTPRGPIKMDKYHQAIMNAYITEVKKIDGKLVNSVIQTYPATSQFWKWSPEDYMKMPALGEMKGKWVK